MIELLVYLVILVIVCIFLYWLMQQVPLPEPLQKIAVIVLVTNGGTTEGVEVNSPQPPAQPPAKVR